MEINVMHRELNPDTVTHLTTNQARQIRWTSLIKTNVLPLCQTITKVFLPTILCFLHVGQLRPLGSCFCISRNAYHQSSHVMVLVFNIENNV